MAKTSIAYWLAIMRTNKQFRFAAKVKSGFGPEHKRVLQKKFKSLRARTSPFKDTPKCKGPGLEEAITPFGRRKLALVYG